MDELTPDQRARPPWERQPAPLTPPWNEWAEPSPARAARRHRPVRGFAVLGAATVAIILAGWIGVAVADTGSTTTTTPGQTAPAPATGQATVPAGAPGPGGPGPFRGGHGGGFGGPGGPGGAIHGQLTVPNGSGYRTIDTQSGEVTDVSQSSITVKSADGFSKTYSVTENTLVDAGRDGIGSVKTGDTVRVNAAEDGTTAEAMNIDDVTTSKAIHDHWRPEAPPATSGGTSGSSSTTTTG